MQGASPVIESLAPYLPYIAVVLVIAVIAIVALTVFYGSRGPARAAARPAPPPPPKLGTPTAPPPQAAPTQSAMERRRVMFDIDEATKNLLGDDLVHDHPYSVPWFVVLGSADAKSNRLTAALDPADPAKPAHNNVSAQNCQVAFAREGAIVEVDPGLLDTSDWTKRWEEVLWFLRGARPDLPADGIVITIPVGWLVGPQALPTDRLSDRGTQFYEAIWEFQKRTGLRVPIYLVLTGAENLQGFSSLVQTNAADLHDEMLGWSTPDALIEDFDPQKIDRGVEVLVAGLTMFELQLFGGNSIPAAWRARRQSAVSDLFLLPAEIRRLTEPLRLFLGTMLRSSVYHEPFLFRGFFLTGSGGRETGDAFVRGLFHRKIFREFQMARAARGIVTARNRRIRIAQASLVALVFFALIGLFSVNLISQQRAADIAPALDTLNALPDGRNVPTLPASPQAQAREARQLLLSFNQLPLTVNTILSPASYLEGADDRVIEALAVGYRRLVLDAIKTGLEEKVARLFGTATARDPATCGIPLPENDPSRNFDADDFRASIPALETLSANIKLYNGLETGNKLANLARLASYALDFELPNDFDEDARLYRRALARSRARPINVRTVQGSVRDALSGGLVAAVANQYDAGLASDTLNKIQDLSDRITAAGPGSPATVDLLRELRDNLRKIEAATDGNTAQWTTPSGNLGPRFEPALVKLRKGELDLASPDLANKLETMGMNCRRAAQVQLAELKDPGGSQILDNSGGAIRLSPGYRALIDTLNQLFSQDFMNADDANLTLPGGGSDPVSWNVALVASAQQAADRYSTVMSGAIESAPRDIAGAVQISAKYRLAKFIVNRLARARGPQNGQTGFADPDSARRAEIRNFAAVAPLLQSISANLAQVNLSDLAIQINQLGAAQARRLLQGVTQELRTARPYRPQDAGFAWWNGAAKMSAQGFGVANQGELTAWVATQRNTIGAMATEQAKPLVAYLTGIQRTGGTGIDDRSDTAAALWSGILEALDDYTNKVPGNSLAALEKFVLADMDLIDLSNCLQSTAMQGTPADYFGESLRQLRADIAASCQTLRGGQFRKQYATAAALFNTSLAGRFPFGGDPGGRLTNWADPDDLRRFYHVFDPMMAALPDQKPAGGATPAQLAFVEQMAALRPVLAPLIADPPQDQPATWEADVEFRADRNLETAGNQVIELALDSAGEHVSSLQTKPVLVWSYGTPLALTLRWAENAPSVPATGGAGTPTVRGLSASWTYDNPWGMFALIADRGTARDTSLPAMARRPETVVVTLPLMKNPQAAQGNDPVLPKATLFVRLKLRAIEHIAGQPDKRTAVTLARFPASAPLQ